MIAEVDDFKRRFVLRIQDMKVALVLGEAVYRVDARKVEHHAVKRQFSSDQPGRWIVLQVLCQTQVNLDQGKPQAAILRRAGPVTLTA